jgi:hypothetical protein
VYKINLDVTQNKCCWLTLNNYVMCHGHCINYSAVLRNTWRKRRIHKAPLGEWWHLLDVRRGSRAVNAAYNDVIRARRHTSEGSDRTWCQLPGTDTMRESKVTTSAYGDYIACGKLFRRLHKNRRRRLTDHNTASTAATICHWIPVRITWLWLLERTNKK